MLQGKKIILGVSGSIAAYKSAFLTRLLVKAGAEVRVVMTPAATDFVGSLTFSTLSKNPVFTDISNESSWNNHVELGLWADAFVVAPATANTLAKMAHAQCDNMLIAVYLSAKCPVFFAPAMDLDMWTHPANQENVRRLQSFGNQLIDAEEGELASGLIGKGRLAEPEHIIAQLQAYFATKTASLPLHGQHIMVTSGPTREAIDPVRFLSNRSTGRMGNAVVQALLAQGATVSMIHGPQPVPPPTHPRLQTHPVQSAQAMYEAAMQIFPQCQAGILTAAVADFTPAEQATHKIKKKDGEAMTLTLARTQDIAQALGAQKTPTQRLVGFALETQNALANAAKKLTRKRFDMLVLNSLEDAGAGFAVDTNQGHFLFADAPTRSFPLQSKQALGTEIVAELIRLLAV